MMMNDEILTSAVLVDDHDHDYDHDDDGDDDNVESPTEDTDLE